MLHACNNTKAFSSNTPLSPPQSYFPSFVESAIYLRFLNELIHTLKVSGDNADSETEAESDAAEDAVATDTDALEDPSYIWQRPSFQYVL